MPAYKTLTLPPALYPGDSYLVFNSEDPANAELSERVALGPDPDGLSQKLSVEIVMASAPGAFEFDLQTSDTDVSTDFVSNPTTITAVTANNVARVEYINIVAKFAALLCVTSPGVSVVAKITR